MAILLLVFILWVEKKVIFLTRRPYKSNFKYLLSIIILLILLGIPSYFWAKKDESTLAATYNSKISPIIIIPGSGANAHRFDNLVKTINQQYDEHHSLLRVTVHTNDRITYSGSVSTTDTHPFIVVGFQNNRDGYPNIKKQAAWFNLAFNALKNRYHFNNFNALGHSNGGLIWTYFFEDYFNDSNIIANRMMTVGTPYNLEESKLANKTAMLNELIKKRADIPKDLSYFSIAGTKGYTDDGIVPLNSVDAGKYIYEGNIKRYTLITLTGSQAEHSDMLTTEQFISLFHQYIVNNGLKNVSNNTSPTSAN